MKKDEQKKQTPHHTTDEDAHHGMAMCVRRHFLRFICVHLQAFNCMYLLVYTV